VAWVLVALAGFVAVALDRNGLVGQLALAGLVALLAQLALLGPKALVAWKVDHFDLQQN